MWPLVIATYVIMSALTCAAYWWDKRAARKGGWRIPEATLHLMELCGGFAGALIAQRLLRHKSYKLGYRLVLWMIVMLHLVGWGAFMAWQLTA